MQDIDPFSLAPFLEFLGAPGAVVLDLGCGTGRHARALRQAGFRVRAVDSDVDALSTARSFDPLPSYCAGDAGALPFASAVFDAVVCLDVLHWSADAAAFGAAWREAARVLRPGGAFCVRLRMADPEWFQVSAEELEAMADRAGFEPLERFGEAKKKPPVPEGGAAFFMFRKTALRWRTSSRW